MQNNVCDRDTGHSVKRRIMNNAKETLLDCGKVLAMAAGATILGKVFTRLGFQETNIVVIQYGLLIAMLNETGVKLQNK